MSKVLPSVQFWERVLIKSRLLGILIATSFTILFCSASQLIIQVIMPTGAPLMPQHEPFHGKLNRRLRLVIPMTKSSLTTFPLAHVRTTWMWKTRVLSSRSQRHLQRNFLNFFSSDVEPLKQGIIKTKKTARIGHTPSFLLERLVSESPRSWNTSPMSLLATKLITTTLTSSTILTS